MSEERREKLTRAASIIGQQTDRELDLSLLVSRALDTGYQLGVLSAQAKLQENGNDQRERSV